jgi:hypothetical protein
MSARTLTLLIAILGMIGTVVAALTGVDSFFHLSPAQAIVVGSLGSGAYALMRTLQKVKVGTPFGALLATSEAKGAFIVYVASLITGVAGIVPPQYAALASGIATVLVGVARQIQSVSSGNSGGTGVGPFAAALVLFGLLNFGYGKIAYAQVDGGAPMDALADVVAAPVPVVAPVVVAPVVVPAPEPAPVVSPAIPVEAAPQIGFLLGDKWTCQIATAAGMQLNLKTGTWKKAVALEGFGCTYRGWKQAVGAAGYLGYSVASGEPNAYQGTLLFSYADWIATGPGVQVFKDPSDPNSWIKQGTWTLSLNYNTGASVDKLIKSLQVPQAAK